MMMMILRSKSLESIVLGSAVERERDGARVDHVTFVKASNSTSFCKYKIVRSSRGFLKGGKSRGEKLDAQERERKKRIEFYHERVL